MDHSHTNKTKLVMRMASSPLLCSVNCRTFQDALQVFPLYATQVAGVYPRDRNFGHLLFGPLSSFLVLSIRYFVNVFI